MNKPTISEDLKTQLQKIIDENSLRRRIPFICLNLSNDVTNEFYKFRSMSKLYAPEHTVPEDIHNNGASWWKFDGPNNQYIIDEKYRFIQDIIDDNI